MKVWGFEHFLSQKKGEVCMSRYILVLLLSFVVGNFNMLTINAFGRFNYDFYRDNEARELFKCPSYRMLNPQQKRVINNMVARRCQLPMRPIPAPVSENNER